MKKVFNVRKLITLSLCFMMCLVTFMPVSVFANCSHKSTKWLPLKKVTCVKDGRYIKVCTKCGKDLKTHYVLTEVETAKGYTLGQNQIKITINQASREITLSAVYHMTVAKDHDVEYSKDDKHFTFSDGTVLDSKDEGL